MIVVGSAREIRDWLDKKIKQNPPEADKRYCMTLQELAPASTPPVIKKSFAERSFDFYKSKQPAKLAPTPPVIKKSFAGRSLDFYKLKKQQAKLASTPPAPEGAGLFGGNPPESGPSAQPSPDGRDKSAHRPAVSGVIYGGIEKGALSKSQRRRINKKKAEQETIERSEHRKDVADEANSTNTVFGSTAGLSGRPGKPHAKTRAELDLDMEGCWAGP
ncbi:hypothetical protein QBC34DRAFT_401382 [Podospora aff. communis PSN243]|uniref:Uncharacterized protein n=1 Tax=Podospora aff. communis PSN243 TaxID=3040156 RepID=A0AAV9GQL8_9PEZI|nr:hypothetical protein QBC34DRAFT_401382 [Podospora aff. communis PSN243]